MKALFVMLIVAALLLYGCAGATSQAPPTGGQNNNEQPPAPPSDKSAGTTVSKGGVLAENKTGYDKTQQTISQVLADGTYNYETTYQHPYGNATVDFGVTVVNDTVTAVSVAGVNPDQKSGMIIGNFAAALPDLVVGKKISEIKLPKNVAGSSLTTAAFQQYVDVLVQTHGKSP